MKRNIFKEVKRIISQWVETEYWYRWRVVYRDGKYKERAFENLNDTWNGHNTLLKSQILKVEHMMYNLRKYGNEVESYIDSPDFLKYGDELDKAWGYLYVVEQIRTRDSKIPFWCGGRYYISYVKDEQKWYVEDRIYVKTIPASELKHPMSSLSIDENGEPVFTPCDKDVYRWETVATFDDVSDLRKFMEENDVANFKDNLIMYEQSIHIAPKDYHNISEPLRSHIRGNRQKLRDLWHYRKLLKQLNEMDFSFSEPYNSKMDEIVRKYGNDINKRKRDAAVEALVEEYNNDRRKIMRQIEDLWIERSEYWWD